MNIICFLTVRPCIETYNFYKYIQLCSDYKVYIVIDDNNYEIPGYDGIVDIVKIDNAECESAGYKNCVLSFHNKACSRDKALYFFNNNGIEFDNIWFIEEDVFIPSIDTIKDIDQKYTSADLLVKSHETYVMKQYNWLWGFVYNNIRIGPPYGKSMICAIRCSKPMMNSIKKYALSYKNLFLDEALFNTLALHDDLNVVCPEELKHIHWKHEWTLSDIEPNYLYHPVKDIQQQIELRKKMIL